MTLIKTPQQAQQELSMYFNENGFPNKIRESWIDVSLPYDLTKIATIEVAGRLTSDDADIIVTVAGWGKFKTQSYKASVSGWKRKVLNRIKLFVSDTEVNIPTIKK